MNEPLANPTRLSRLSEAHDRLGVGRMFRSARELPDEDLPRLRWRLRTSQRLRAMRPRLFLRVALVVGLVFCMGGVVGAMVSPFLARRKATPVTDPAPSPAPAAKHRTARPAPPAAAVPSEPILRSETVAPASTPVADGPKPVSAPARHKSPLRVALREPAVATIPRPATEPRPAATSAIALEQALLAEVIKRLRDGHDPDGALGLLEQHARQFPHGALASEATMLRIEALLGLGRQDEALSVLDGVSLASLPNRDEQLVVRGELRAGSGRWREAKQDFDQVLGGGDPPVASAKGRKLQERALWGRAAARVRIGDQQGARADLALYLRYFPAGRFADRAASLLKGVP